MAGEEKSCFVDRELILDLAPVADSHISRLVLTGVELCSRANISSVKLGYWFDVIQRSDPILGSKFRRGKARANNSCHDEPCVVSVS